MGCSDLALSAGAANTGIEKLEPKFFFALKGKDSAVSQGVWATLPGLCCVCQVRDADFESDDRPDRAAVSLRLW
jgi:hypothetical protein